MGTSDFEIGEAAQSAIFIGGIAAGVSVAAFLFFFYVLARRYHSQHVSSQSFKCLNATVIAMPATLLLLGIVAFLVGWTSFAERQAYDLLVVLMVLAALLIVLCMTKFDSKTTFIQLPLVMSFVFVLAAGIVAINMGRTSSFKSGLEVSNIDVLGFEDVSDHEVLFTLQYTSDEGESCRVDLRMDCEYYFGAFVDYDDDNIENHQSIPENVDENAILSTIDTKFLCTYFSYENQGIGYVDNDDEANADNYQQDNDGNQQNDDGGRRRRLDEGGNGNNADAIAYNVLIHPSNCFVDWYTARNAGMNWETEWDAIIFFGVSALVTATLFGLWYAVLKWRGVADDDKVTKLMFSATRAGCTSSPDDDAWTYQSADSVMSNDSTIPTKEDSFLNRSKNDNAGNQANHSPTQAENSSAPEFFGRPITVPSIELHPRRRPDP